jgi:hypothetical protein
MTAQSRTVRQGHATQEANQQMSTGERKPTSSFLERARDLALNVLIFAGAQILLALLFWQLFFRTHPQGFAMGLTLVGFGSWALSFLTSSRGRFRLRSPLETRPQTKTREPSGDAHARASLQDKLGGAGCGTVLFLSGLVSLGLAFVLRVRADMQAGMTWSDIFPIGP